MSDHTALAHTDTWELKDSDQDVRGWPVIDKQTNRRLGTVEKMIVNEDEEIVDTLVLENGFEIPARDVLLTDEVVYHVTNGVDHHGTAVVFEDNTGVAVEEPVQTPLSDPIVASFQNHYALTYRQTGQPYAYYADAYRYGYDAAQSEEYSGRSFAESETDLRTHFISRYSGADFGDYREAVKYGYEYMPPAMRNPQG